MWKSKTSLSLCVWLSVDFRIHIMSGVRPEQVQHRPHNLTYSHLTIQVFEPRNSDFSVEFVFSFQTQRRSLTKKFKPGAAVLGGKHCTTPRLEFIVQYTQLHTQFYMNRSLSVGAAGGFRVRHQDGSLATPLGGATC